MISLKYLDTRSSLFVFNPMSFFKNVHKGVGIAWNFCIKMTFKEFYSLSVIIWFHV